MENSTNDSVFNDTWINDPNGASHFNITIDDVPQITNNSNVTGTTGDLFTFNVSVFDYVDSPDNLTVNVSWSHGGISDNTTLGNTGGDYFEESITLDHSISDMLFTIWANDTSGNSNSYGTHIVSVVDNDDPVFVSDDSLGSGSTGDSFIFDIKASDNVGVGGVNLCWSHGSLGGNLALVDDGDGSWSDGVVLGGQVGVKDNIEVEAGTMVGAASCVWLRGVASKQLFGNPAIDKREQLRLTNLRRRLPELVEQLKQLSARIERLENSGQKK